VFISEVCINPPGSLDDTREYIELQGVPGRKLDGYAIAFLNGSLEKYYPRNSIPPLPDPKPEIDEFFSLDGLELGANGLLVLAITNIGFYPEVLQDTMFFGPWSDLWNGGLDPANRLSNDGSNTVLLIRNRPGRTEADPINSGGLRWAKARYQDFELIRNVIDPQDGIAKDQWGDGGLDHGQTNGLNGSTTDVLGETTPSFLDDLEVVDEVSYESERGWEYETDDRHADVGSTAAALPERRVHALDDPQGFNPDALTRVDYRVTGSGWIPVAGAAGELPNGRNWQDTATEQWIRGETDNNVVYTKFGPEVYYWNDPSDNPDSIQPYLTNVPLWLNDGIGTDYNFGSSNTYRLLAGQINALAVPFIPGDTDRDGDCDSADIQQLRAVFGDEDWIFSNAFAAAPEGNDGDPSAQTRPWDVDLTGDNGIEASDLQWVLNFQGDMAGRVVGVRYDSTAPSIDGVNLGPSHHVTCAITTAVEVPCGRPTATVHVGDFLDVVVYGQVTGGAQISPSFANGIMQYVHDVSISTGGVLRAISDTALGAFSRTRATLTTPSGSIGDRGLATVNGYSTSFDQGLSGPAELYRIRLQAIGVGTARVEPRAAAIERFAQSTPLGLKIGHTDHQGNPGNVIYATGVQIVVMGATPPLPDCNGDGQVLLPDHACFVDCLTGPNADADLTRSPVDANGDGDVDLADYGSLMVNFGN